MSPLNTQLRLQRILAIVKPGMYHLSTPSASSPFQSVLSPNLTPITISLQSLPIHLSPILSPHATLPPHHHHPKKTKKKPTNLRVPRTSLHPHRAIPLHEQRTRPLPRSQLSRNSQPDRTTADDLCIPSAAIALAAQPSPPKSPPLEHPSIHE